MIHKTLSKLILTSTAFLALSACTNTSTMYPEHTAQHSVIHSPTSSLSAHPSWSYMGNTGPSYWGELEGNELCKVGFEQSPIDIQRVTKSTDKTPKSSYSVSDIEIVNNGHTVVFTPKNGRNLSIIDDEVYELKQFHYHTPSEHQISGVNYPGEIHFVHANSQGGLAVLGVMLNPNNSVQTTLNPLLKGSVIATSENKPILVNAIDLDQLLPKDTKFYKYAGSLTTPPCSEKVKWFVATQPLSINPTELHIFKELYNGNNRPVKPLGNRVIELID